MPEAGTAVIIEGLPSHPPALPRRSSRLSRMIRKPDEDLFKDTTMTFGEHLEELRGCLWKAMIGLVAGFLIGMWFAEDVVKFIKTPMEDALGVFHSKLVVQKFEKELALGKELGLKVVAEGVDAREQLQFLAQRGCQEFQGYLCSRPAPAELFERLARRTMPQPLAAVRNG